MDELARQFLSAKRDSRTVTTDPNAGYYGTQVNDQSLTPTGPARRGKIRFSQWLSSSTPST
jgi:hypothetical protein